MIYTRVSTEEQTRKDYNSLESQDEHCQKYIDLKKHDGWEYIDTYTDPGFSGGNLNRPGLTALRRDARLGKFDMVVCYKIDRLTRSLKDFYVVWEEFEQFKVGFSASSQEINTATSQGKLMLNMLLSFAQYEREINSERVRDKLAQKAAKGHWIGGWVPFGYDYDAAKKLLIPNPNEALAVNLIFELFCQTKSQKTVATRLNALGYRTKPRDAKDQKESSKAPGGLRFSPGRVTDILKNPLYLGVTRFKGKDYDGQHEPILNDRKLWFTAAEALKKRANPKEIRDGVDSYTFLLKGLVYCGVCKSCMSSDFSGKKDKNGLPYLYYTCTAVKRYGSDCECNLRSIPARPVEDIVIKALRFLSSNDNVLGKIIERSSEEHATKIKPLEESAAELNRRLQDVTTRMKNIVQLLAKKGHMALSDELEAELESLQQDRRELTEQSDRVKYEIRQRRKAT